MFALSDLHSSPKFLEEFEKEFKEKKGEIFFLTGDLVVSNHFVDKVFSFLENISKNNRVFAIPGNCDEKFVEKKLDELGINVDKKRKEIEEKGLNVVGFGGSLKTPFSTPNERDEEDFYSIFELVDSKTILLSHTPPFGIFDEIEHEHIGSKVLLEIIEKRKPYMLLCGHVHEVWGVKKVGPTTVIKLPPANIGFITEINNKVEFKNILKR